MRALAACAVVLAACGYPDFAFQPQDDGGVSDSGAGDGSIDSTVDAAHDDTLASDVVAKDSGVDVVADSSADSGVLADTTSETPPADTSDPCAPLDDMEDGNGYILAICGRSGTWYTYDDGTAGGTQTPPPGTLAAPELIPSGRGSSTYAEHTFGSGFTSWGAGIGFNFIDGGPSYDVHAYGGLQFWARSPGAKAYPRLAVADKDTDKRGGVCNGTAAGCGDHFGIGLVVGTDWGLQTVRFSDFKQEGWGFGAGAFDPSAVYGVAWQIAGGSGASFDLWTDDVTLVP